MQKAFSDAVYVIDGPQDNRIKVSRVCPNCGNGEALRLISSVSGEHAGVRQERTVDHFRCTKCSHSWGESS
jgi:DNA-directed RNA polymerase subunit M/transcription elongation factor TFIIS